MRKQQLLNEIMGVSKAVDFWTEYFSIIILGMAKGITNSDTIDEREISYENEEGEEVEDKAYRGTAQVKGKEFMNWVIQIGGYSDLKDLLKDPKFQQLPLYNPKLTLTLFFLPEEVLRSESRKDISDFVEAQHSFDASKKFLSKVGKSEVFVNQNFSFQVHLSHNDLNNLNLDRLKSQIKPVISHELTHSYEGYRRIKTSGDPLPGRESFLNIATRLMSDDKYPQWREFLHLVYLHLGFEINARIPQFYYSIRDKDITSTEEFLKYLKDSTPWKEAELLENFDAKKFIDSFKIKGLGLGEMLQDIGKQMERQSQGLPTIRPAKSAKEGMKHLIQGWDYVLQKLNVDLSAGPYRGKLMELVPQSALEDPYVFFKFFEKRFHKKAKRFKKKLYNISSLVMDKSLIG